MSGGNHPHGDCRECSSLREANAVQARTIERARAALEVIRDWKLPPTGKAWPSGNPTSYEAEYGSNGARDYMRKVAAQALNPEEGA